MSCEFTSEEVDRIQFTGRYQLRSQSPCCNCRFGLLNPEGIRVTGLIGKGSFGEVYLVDFGKNKVSFAMKATRNFLRSRMNVTGMWPSFQLPCNNIVCSSALAWDISLTMVTLRQ